MFKRDVSYYTDEAVVIRGRVNLLIIVVCSLINAGILYMGYYMTIPYSSGISQLLMLATGFLYSDGLALAFILLGLLVIGVYLLFYVLSKKNTVWLLAAAGLYIVDTLLLGLYPVLWGTTAIMTMLIDLAFHVWALFYLLPVWRAYGNLRTKAARPPVGQPVRTVDAEIISDTKDEEK